MVPNSCTPKTFVLPPYNDRTRSSRLLARPIVMLTPRSGGETSYGPSRDVDRMRQGCQRSGDVHGPPLTRMIVQISAEQPVQVAKALWEVR